MNFNGFLVANLKKLLNKIILFLKNFFLYCKKLYINFPIFKLILEKLQITIIYFLYYFTFVDLFISTSKGYIYPTIFLEFLNLNLKILDIPFLAFLSNRDNTYFLHLIITQIVMQRKEILFTNHVKFHIILLSLIDSLGRLAFDYLSFFTGQDSLGNISSKFTTYFYIIIFSISIFSYFYSYICGLIKMDPVFPAPFDIITKSAYFWLRTKQKNKKKIKKFSD
jgi:hypothetical protein